MSSKVSPHGLLRRVEWNRFHDLTSEDPNPLEITDVVLTADELLEAWEVFGRIEILAEQKRGIYDGARYGRDLYNDSNGELEEAVDWIRGNTFGRLEDLLTVGVRDKMNWKAIPYANDF